MIPSVNIEIQLFRLNLTLKDPFISESCIKIKI